MSISPTPTGVNPGTGFSASPGVLPTTPPYAELLATIDATTSASTTYDVRGFGALMLAYQLGSVLTGQQAVSLTWVQPHGNLGDSFRTFRVNRASLAAAGTAGHIVRRTIPIEGRYVQVAPPAANGGTIYLFGLPEAPGVYGTEQNANASVVDGILLEFAGNLAGNDRIAAGTSRLHEGWATVTGGLTVQAGVLIGTDQVNSANLIVVSLPLHAPAGGAASATVILPPLHIDWTILANAAGTDDVGVNIIGLTQA